MEHQLFKHSATLVLSPLKFHCRFFSFLQDNPVKNCFSPPFKRPALRADYLSLECLKSGETFKRHRRRFSQEPQTSCFSVCVTLCAWRSRMWNCSCQLTATLLFIKRFDPPGALGLSRRRANHVTQSFQLLGAKT